MKQFRVNCSLLLAVAWMGAALSFSSSGARSSRPGLRPAHVPAIRPPTKRSTAAPDAENETMLEGFEWWQAGGGVYWKLMASRAESLAGMGVTAVWLPPPTKGYAGASSNGYDAYDLWDLGEFDQKGTTPTKWGTKPEFEAAVAALEAQGIASYVDAVLNHRMGGDETETFTAQEVNSDDRLENVGDASTVEGWTKFTFAGRGGEYSSLQLSSEHFTGLDYDQKTNTSAIWRIQGREWSTAVSDYLGNYDFLMGCDVDYSNRAVADDVISWGEWITNTTGTAGFRLDAVKSLDSNFTSNFVADVRSRLGQNLFVVAEYWDTNLTAMSDYIDCFGSQNITLFDSALHYNFYDAAQAGADYDLRTIFNGSLVQDRPSNAVTLVDNHDTQPGQESASFVDAAFKPIAYALILFREDGYPCVFAGDLYGLNDTAQTAAMPQLTEFVKVRKYFAYGDTTDYWDDASTVGWVRAGNANHDGAAVIVSIAEKPATLSMQLDNSHAGETWIDVLGNSSDNVTIAKDGSASFGCGAHSVSVWVNAASASLAQFESNSTTSVAVTGGTSATTPTRASSSSGPSGTPKTSASKTSTSVATPSASAAAAPGTSLSSLDIGLAAIAACVLLIFALLGCCYAQGRNAGAARRRTATLAPTSARTADPKRESSSSSSPGSSSASDSDSDSEKDSMLHPYTTDLPSAVRRTISDARS